MIKNKKFKKVYKLAYKTALECNRLLKKVSLSNDEAKIINRIHLFMITSVSTLEEGLNDKE